MRYISIYIRAIELYYNKDYNIKSWRAAKSMATVEYNNCERYKKGW